MKKITAKIAAFVFMALAVLSLAPSEAGACESMKADRAAAIHEFYGASAELNAGDNRMGSSGACHEVPCCHVGACCWQAALYAPSVKNTHSHNFGHVTQSMYAPAVLSLLPHSIERPPKLFF